MKDGGMMHLNTQESGRACAVGWSEGKKMQWPCESIGEIVLST